MRIIHLGLDSHSTVAQGSLDNFLAGATIKLANLLEWVTGRYSAYSSQTESVLNSSSDRPEITKSTSLIASELRAPSLSIVVRDSSGMDTQT